MKLGCISKEIMSGLSGRKVMILKLTSVADVRGMPRQRRTSVPRWNVGADPRIACRSSRNNSQLRCRRLGAIAR